MMADQDTPRVLMPTRQLSQHGIEIIEIDDAIGPVQPALDAPRRVDGRDPDQAIAELDDPANAVEPVHVAPIEFEG